MGETEQVYEIATAVASQSTHLIVKTTSTLGDLFITFQVMMPITKNIPRANKKPNKNLAS
jgi:hypothetical protein